MAKSKVIGFATGEKTMYPEADEYDDDRDEYDGDEPDQWEYEDYYDNPADDYIMTEPELRGHL